MAGPVGIINEEAASSSVTGSRKRIWRCTMGAQGGLLTQWTNGVIAVRVDQMSGRRKRGPCNTCLPQLGSILQGLSFLGVSPSSPSFAPSSSSSSSSPSRKTEGGLKMCSETKVFSKLARTDADDGSICVKDKFDRLQIISLCIC